MKRKLLTNTLMVLMIMAVTGSLLPAVSYAAEQTFTWESVTDLGSTVEETVGGIKVTVSGITKDDTAGNINILPYPGYTGYYVGSTQWLKTMTFTFSKAVDIISIDAKNVTFETVKWTYTPTGGSNPAREDKEIGPNSVAKIPLNWTEVTSFTVTSTLVENSFGFDNLVIRTPSLAHNVAGDLKVFSELTAGNSDESRENLTVTITSTKTNNNITATLSGANPDSFTLTENLTTLDNGQTGTFSIMPNNGLAPGTYNATVTITSDEFPAGVSFTVQHQEAAAAVHSATHQVILM